MNQKTLAKYHFRIGQYFEKKYIDASIAQEKKES